MLPFAVSNHNGFAAARYSRQFVRTAREESRMSSAKARGAPGSCWPSSLTVRIEMMLIQPACAAARRERLLQATNTPKNDQCTTREHERGVNPACAAASACSNCTQIAPAAI